MIVGQNVTAERTLCVGFLCAKKQLLAMQKVANGGVICSE